MLRYFKHFLSFYLVYLILKNTTLPIKHVRLLSVSEIAYFALKTTIHRWLQGPMR